MKLFLPDTTPADTAEAYRLIVERLKQQFKLPITGRQIHALSYVNNKRKWTLRVGELADQEERFTVVAIVESKTYIAVTQDALGKPGVLIMVNPDEVTEVIEFED